MDWYDSLDTPSWTPPAGLFGPVWTVLYAAMAVAAVLVVSKVGVGREMAVFALQLALNVAWPIVFFGWHRLGLSVAVILVLIPAIAVCTVMFWKVTPLAGALLIPYLAWVCFAAALNVAIALRN